LRALAAHASGAVLLSEGRAPAALRVLREAYRIWRGLEALHQAASVRVLMGIGCRELGDTTTATLELDAARSAFHQLGAAPDVERVELLLGTTQAASPL